MKGSIMIKHKITEENSVFFGALVVICAIMVGLICFYI